MSELIENILAGMTTIILIICVGTAILMMVPEPTVAQGPPVYSAEEFKDARRYHGIHGCEMIDGEWGFWRDGQWCKLFAYLGER